MCIRKQQTAIEQPFSGPRVATRGIHPAIGLAVAAAIAGFSAPVMPAFAAAADNSSQDALDVVIVTARKRSENLQDVPLSINVLSKKDLGQLDI